LSSNHKSKTTAASQWQSRKETRSSNLVEGRITICLFDNQENAWALIQVNHEPVSNPASEFHLQDEEREEQRL
jgi:hypothetical protein